MNLNPNIIGCFVSGPATIYGDDEEITLAASQKGEEFSKYIWGEAGICNNLKKLMHENYGRDLRLILFQFYLNPIQYELEHLKEIESYRKKEKAIGIPIIINNENFFNKSERDRYRFLRESILGKIKLLSETIKAKKLDTNTELLMADLEKLFE